jgi:hypothetical protein
MVLLAGCTLVVGDVDPRDTVGRDAGLTPCADVLTDPHNCGACGRDCTTLPGVNPGAVRCTAGQCDLREGCLPGRADCGGGYIDGCESDLASAAHCGNCFSQCGGDAPFCTRTSGGLYTCAVTCPFGTTQCGSTCADVFTDSQHCGSCSHACAASANQVPVCQNGVCGTECAPGTHVCGGLCVDSNNLQTCGTGCTPCPSPPAHGAEICDPFAGCDYTCEVGYAKSLGGCVQSMTFDMKMSDMLPLCDCRGLHDPLGTTNQCPLTSQCVGNNCCLENQLMMPPTPGTCVDPTPCAASTTPQ